MPRVPFEPELPTPKRIDPCDQHQALVAADAPDLRRVDEIAAEYLVGLGVRPLLAVGLAPMPRMSTYCSPSSPSTYSATGSCASSAERGLAALLPSALPFLTKGCMNTKAAEEHTETSGRAEHDDEVTAAACDGGEACAPSKTCTGDAGSPAPHLRRTLKQRRHDAM